MENDKDMERFLLNSFFELTKPDILSMDVIDGSTLPLSCPRCGEEPYIVNGFEGDFKEVKVLEGPFLRYRKRESELYFDLEKKYLNCIRCGHEMEVMDFQVIVEKISSKLPPKQARNFSMKNMRQFKSNPEKMKMILTIFMDDFEVV